MAQYRHASDPAPVLQFQLTGNQAEVLVTPQVYVLQWTTNPTLFANPAGRTPENFYPLDLTSEAGYTRYRTVIASLPEFLWGNWGNDTSIRRLYYRFGAGDVANPADDSWDWLPYDHYVINHAPVAEGGEDVLAVMAADTVDQDVVLDASATVDPDPNTSLDFEWKLADAPNVDPDNQAAVTFVETLNGRLQNLNGPQVTAIPAGTPVPQGAQGTYKFCVGVTDDDPASFYGTRGQDSDTVSIHVGGGTSQEGITIHSPTTEQPAMVERPTPKGVTITYQLDPNYLAAVEASGELLYWIQVRVTDEDDKLVYYDQTVNPTDTAGSFTWHTYRGRGLQAAAGAFDVEVSVRRTQTEPFAVDGYGGTTTQEDAVHLDPLGFWEDLISFRPPIPVQQIVRTEAPDGYVHRIEDAHGGLVNLDYYPVRITQLPSFNGQQLSATQLLNQVRLNLNSIIKTRYSTFQTYESTFDGDWNRQNAIRWTSTDPTGAVIHIDLAGPDNASVVVGHADPSKWVFCTAFTLGDFHHPVSGNREFGIRQNDDGSYTAYTRGADRTTTYQDIDFSFTVAHWLWESFQDGLVDFVNDNGGIATVERPVSTRLDWDFVRDRAFDPTGAWLYP